MYIYIYIYIYVCVCMCVCIYMCVYVYIYIYSVSFFFLVPTNLLRNYHYSVSDCNTVVNEFEQKSRLYVHFSKSINPFILSAMRRIEPIIFFGRAVFALN